MTLNAWSWSNALKHTKVKRAKRKMEERNLSISSEMEKIPPDEEDGFLKAKIL